LLASDHIFDIPFSKQGQKSPLRPDVLRRDHLEIKIDQSVRHHCDPILTIKVPTGADDPAKLSLYIDTL
jgi:hypothetical protein